MEVSSPTQPAGRLHLSPNAIAHALFVPNGVITVILGPLLPLLASRWELNDTQAGYLLTAQFVGCLLATLSSGEILPWLGFRWTMVIGLSLMTFGTATLMASKYPWAIAAVFCNGLGIGLSTLTTNLLVARTPPDRRASSLNLLNFFWSAGAMVCPFLVAAFQSAHHIPVFLLLVAGIVGMLMLALIMTPVHVPAQDSHPTQQGSRLQYLRTPTAVLLGALFFVYIGTESSFGLWLASYAKRASDIGGTWWATIPSYFYGALLVGRLVAPLGRLRGRSHRCNDRAGSDDAEQRFLDRVVDAQAAERDAALGSMIEMGAAAIVAHAEPDSAAVRNMEPAPAMTAAQETGQQRIATAY